MILPDDTPESPTKIHSAMVELPEAHPTQEYQLAPPAYTGYASYQSGHSTYAPQSPAPRTPPPVQVVSDIERRTGKKFLKALLIAGFIWTLVVGFMSSVVGVGQHSWRDREWSIGIPKQNPVDSPSYPRPIPRDGKIIRCVNGYDQWSHENGVPMISFDLPLSSDVLYMFSRGTFSSGSVVLIQDASVDPNSVHVDVASRYWTPDLLASSSVCSMERAPSQRGIGFFARIPRNSAFTFDVTVRLPVSSDDELVRVASFETNLPQFSHHFSNLRNRVIFDKLSVKTSNAPVICDTIDAEHAEITTSNGAISGSFKTSTSLALVTSNAEIDARVDLFHDDARPATVLDMKTSNAPLISDIRLLSTSSPSMGGTFNISAQTSNAPLSLEIPSAPLSSRPHLDAHTSNSAATITLPREFEGQFLLSSSNSQHLVHYDVHAEDPSGEGRTRIVTLRRVRKILEGAVTWGWNPERKALGYANIQTSHSPVVMKLL